MNDAIFVTPFFNQSCAATNLFVTKQVDTSYFLLMQLHEFLQRPVHPNLLAAHAGGTGVST